MNTEYKQLKLGVRQKVGILIPAWLIYLGMGIAVVGPVFARPVILRCGKDTVGRIDRKFETHGKEHAFGLGVRFQADKNQSYSYWVHPIDFQKTSVGEAVQLRYLEIWPRFFALEQYRQYSDSACYVPVFIFGILVFATVYLIYGEQIGRFLKRISGDLKVSLRVIEWSVAVLCIAVTVSIVVLINRVISPY